MAVAVGDVWAFALDARLFGQQVINTGAMRISSVPGGTTEQAFIVSMFGTAGKGMLAVDKWLSTLSDLQTTEVTYLRWIISRVTPNPTTAFTPAVVGILSGTTAGTCETANIGMSITRKGLDKGKRNKGRVAIAGINTTSMADGIFSPGVVATAEAFAQWLWRPVTGQLGEIASMGFYVPEHDGIAHGAPVHYPAKYTDCVDANVQKTVRVQRSRTIGVGR